MFLAVGAAVPPSTHDSARCSIIPFHPRPRGPGTLILGVGATDTIHAGVGAVVPTGRGGHTDSGRPRQVYGQLIRILNVGGTDTDLSGEDSLIVIVPWDHDSACRPTYWSRSAAWVPVGLEGSYSVRLRPQSEWGEYPVADAFMAALQPYPHGTFYQAGYMGTRAIRERASLTASEYFSLALALPTREEAAENPAALRDRLLAWEAANPALSTRYPADEMIAALKRMPR